jgi:hypothetical protein
VEVTDISWCERHSKFLRDLDIAPEAIVEALLHSVAAQGAAARGHSTPDDMDLAAKAITRSANGQPFCCWLGDEKLHAIVGKALANHDSEP